MASVLLYPKTLGGGAVFSGWVPFNHSMIEQFPEEAKKVPSDHIQLLTRIHPYELVMAIGVLLHIDV